MGELCCRTCRIGTVKNGTGGASSFCVLPLAALGEGEIQGFMHIQEQLWHRSNREEASNAQIK